ncbi:hypothetical protein BB559_001905 [Furculomyces boomerangus]|uniref:Dihydrolipoamide acetyltransferase component of pyruvate dehydrogenase complex n=2 Tax=Harpellales TaxID=61421 RepID=A0A2T9YZN3_9FUNG|nr:hypothetical protein BB559_001905 [Furculomyces boomerangus]PVZ98469.1 hypothetical protein BB558_005525 [Smittium angustum]PWA02348.1 hypothetical protein BB558_001512 [Smittium angustum]
MPSLSPTMTEGKISNWLVAEGESFVAGQVLLQVETDKAQMDVEAADDGILAKILTNSGSDSVPVGSTIAILAEEGDDLTAISNMSLPSQAAPAPKPNVSNQEIEPVPISKETPIVSNAPNLPRGKAASGDLSPSASYLVKSKQMSNYRDIKGTGMGGRIMKSDVLSFIKSGSAIYDTSKSTESVSPISEQKILTNIPKSPAKPSDMDYLVYALNSSEMKSLSRAEFTKKCQSSTVNYKIQSNEPNYVKNDGTFTAAIAKAVSSALNSNPEFSILVYEDVVNFEIEKPTFLFTEKEKNITPETIKNETKKGAYKIGVENPTISIVFKKGDEVPSTNLNRDILLIGSPYRRIAPKTKSLLLSDALDFVISRKTTYKEPKSQKPTQGNDMAFTVELFSPGNKLDYDAIFGSIKKEFK